MPHLSSILQGVIFFGSGLSLLMALQQLSGKDPDRLNVLGFMLLVCNSIIMLNIALALSRAQIAYPIISFPFLPVIFAVGPLNLFYDHSLVDPKQPISYKTRLHILPAAVITVIGLIFQFQDALYKEAMIRGLFDEPLRSPLAVVIIVGCAHVFAYLSYISVIEFSLWNSAEIRSEIRFMAGLNLAAKVAVILLAAGFFLQRPNLLISGGILLTLIHVAIFLAHHRYPHFFQTLKREIKRKRYEKSLLSGINTEVVYARLMELMRDEELYKDMELNLKTVADLLSMTPHQLSQFLNERINQDFRNFVNSFRVAEAKRQLLEHPDRGILEICFEAGFNSKSTFNTVFKKHTGMTPREYRAGRSG
ncbi:MAG TPA: helix-turn-helix domain-containing protein [Deltaproteobacteria bacterium]|nr:helix-turn-helix domain-containing protein [Deltaproteobacteria bacterium]HQI80300.1 helix-turn-helix domain-containing protein [Deltaproteobacteria bacterium]